MWGRLRIILLIGTAILWAFFAYVVIDSSIIHPHKEPVLDYVIVYGIFHLPRYQFHLSGSTPKKVKCASAQIDLDKISDAALRACPTSVLRNGRAIAPKLHSAWRVRWSSRHCAKPSKTRLARPVLSRSSRVALVLLSGSRLMVVVATRRGPHSSPSALPTASL